MVRNLLALSAISLLSACGAVNSVESNGSLHLPALNSYDFYLDGGDAQERTAAQNAAAEWEKFTGVHITLHDGSRFCGEGCFTIIEPSEKILDFVTFEKGFVGYTIPGLIAVGSGLSQAETNETMIHEMGHALGLEHHTGVSAVMEPSYHTAANHVTCNDVSQFFAVRNTPIPNTVTPCTNARGFLDAGTD